MLDGILLIDKPAGFTSFDVIAKLRGMTRTKKIGHAGTLDPMATGVLPVFFGRAAKAVDLLPSHDKAYIAGFKLGSATDTQDITGRILYEKNHSVTAREVEDALSSFTGGILQTPPMYSAVRVNGKRLYDLARSGREIERKPRNVIIYELRLLESDEASGVYSIFLKCSGGTYVRTLCHDLGERLGCGAVMTSLRRTMACGYELKDCITLETAEERTASGALKLLPVSSVFSDLPELVLNESQAHHFLNGIQLGLDQFSGVPKVERIRAVDGGGRFLGLAKADGLENKLVIVKLFALGEPQ
ncbi:MAG: tRNA pseudouridine(55) synthase TruB [Oscillospiraceae bacterium]|nr:tRNA pseudouridine(55) synthase TruB [Oscillospiraceae bacterium]